MKQSQKIKIPIYCCDLQVIVTDQIAEESGKIFKRYKVKEEPFFCAGRVISNSEQIGKYFVLFDHNNTDANTVAHEVYHLTRIISNHRDIEEEESQAWLCGFIMESIMNFLHKKELIKWRTPKTPKTLKVTPSQEG